MKTLPLNLRSGLKLWIDWSNNGTTWYDQSGNGYNMTWSNTPVSSRRLQSKQTKFNGTNQNMVSSTGLWISLTSLTISAWYNPWTLPTSTQERRVISLLNSSAQSFAYVELYQSLYYAITWVWWSNGTLQPSTPIPVVWRHAMITIVQTWSTMYMYINWSLITSTSSWTFSWTIDKFEIWWNASSNYADWYVSNAMVWDRALSSTEVQQLYNSQYIK